MAEEATTGAMGGAMGGAMAGDHARAAALRSAGARVEAAGVAVGVRAAFGMGEVAPMARVAHPKALAVEEKRARVRVALRCMAEGKTLEEAAEVVGLPAAVVRWWVTQSPQLSREYRMARALQGQAFADEAVRVARASVNGSGADRLLVDTLKWAAMKANPMEFGEKQTVEHQGAQRLEVVVVEENPSVKGGEEAFREMENALTEREARHVRAVEGAVVVSARGGGKR